MSSKEIEKLNTNFKNSIYKEVLINMGLIVSAFVFFYILFDGTKSIVLGIYDLNWSKITLSLIDLVFSGIVFVYIYSIKNFINESVITVKSEENDPLEKNEDRIKNQIKVFYEKKIKEIEDTVICYCTINLFFIIYNVCLYVGDGVFDDLSILNSVYLKTFFNIIPLFPLQIVFIGIFFGIIIPIFNSYKIYLKKLELMCQLDNSVNNEINNKFSLITFCKYIFLILLSIFFGFISLQKENESYYFKYISDNKINQINIEKSSSRGDVIIVNSRLIRKEYFCETYKIKEKHDKIFIYFYVKDSGDGWKLNRDEIKMNEKIDEKTKQRLIGMCI